MVAINLLLSGHKVSKQSIEPFAIVSPQVGQSGIYQIYDNVGGTFPAYVDMVSDGGFWILDASWTAAPAPAQRLTFERCLQKGKPLYGYTDDAVLRPAIPNGKFTANPAEEWMLQIDSDGWQAVYGPWQRGSLYASNKASFTSNEAIGVVTPVGDKYLYAPRSAWSEATPMTFPLGFWTHPSNGGQCGGQGRVGPTKICPIMDGSYTQHCDFTHAKRLFLRASNAPKR